MEFLPGGELTDAQSFEHPRTGAQLFEHLCFNYTKFSDKCLDHF